MSSWVAATNIAYGEARRAGNQGNKTKDKHFSVIWPLPTDGFQMKMPSTTQVCTENINGDRSVVWYKVEKMFAWR